MAKKKRDPERKKRSLLSSLFEPADAPETDGLFDEPAPEDDAELVHLFDDDDVEYSDEQDEAVLSDLTWNDGEHVVEDVSSLTRQVDAAHRKRRADRDEPQEDRPAARRKKGKRRQHAAAAGSPHRVARLHPTAEGEPPLPDEPLPDEPAPAAQAPVPTGGMDAAAFLTRSAAPARDAEQAPEATAPAYEAHEESAPAYGAPEGSAEAAGMAGESAKAPAEGAATFAGAPPAAPADGPGSREGEPPIRLFDDDTPPARRGSRTRMFRTGSGTAARINMNETETLRSIDEAKRRQREKEAQRQHEAYVQRQKRQRRRKRAMKRMAANIAFVSFIVIAVLAALYFTFLLKDIVVSGNETYSDEYIIGLSGLQYGRHMLLCDLDAARAGIEEDPYLQVDAVDYIFPARVRIQVTERKEVAGILGLDYNVIIDHNGYVLSMGGGTDLTDLLQVTGVSMTGFQVGQRLGQSDDFSTATLITMINKLEEYMLLDDIASLDLTTPLAIVMYAKNGLKIHVGQPTDLDEKMLSLHENLPQFLSAGISTGTLYLSARGGTVYSPAGAGALASPDPESTDPGTNDPNIADPTLGDPTTTGGLTPQTPDPGLTVTPPPATATPLQPGGSDEFQG